MATTPITNLPPVDGLDGSELVPVVQAGVTSRATVTQIASKATGFVPVTRVIQTGNGLSGGGALDHDLLLDLSIDNLLPVSSQDATDSFLINQESTGLPKKIVFADSMKTMGTLPVLAFPNIAADTLMLLHAADGSMYQISASSLSLATGNMPAGGLAGQILTKNSDANYDTTWTSGGFIDQAANTVFSGPASGVSAQPSFRTLVGADLPNPGASSKGGVQSKAAVSSQFLTQISTTGVVSAAQPAFTDVSGTAAVVQGGTGLSSYTIGDLIYASGTTALSKLADVATGSALISGGVGVAPSWGKIDLTTTISGILPVANGGTGQSTLAAHGVVLGNGTSGVSVTGTGTSGQVLTSNGLSADPTFQDATTALGQALTVGNDTNVTLTLGGAPTTALLSASSVTAGWTGQLAVTRGGTGLATVAQGDLLYGSALNTLASLSKSTTATRYLANTGTNNSPAWAQINLANGVTGTLPGANGGTGLASGTSGGSLYWSNNSTLASTAALAANELMIGGGAGTPFATLGSTGTATTVLHGNAAGAPTFGAVSLTADVSGTLPVTSGGTGAASFNQFGALYGNGTSAIQVTSAGTQGTILGAMSLAGPQFRTVSAVLDDAISNTQGSLLYRSLTGWVALAPGTAGFVLSSNGAASDPSWISVGGVGTVTSVDVSGGTTGITTSGGPITGAGTITLAGTLGTANGGTNLTAYTQGDILYASSSSVLSKLPKDTNATRYLSNSGTTNNPAWSQIDLTNGVMGALPVVNGGTGRSTLTNHGVIVGAGTGAVTQLAAAAAGTVLAGQGATADPAFTATPTLGVAGTTQGSVAIAGATSGTVTVAAQAAAGTYNFNLPTSAGTSGQPLLSGGGVGAPMTFGTLGVAAGGTGLTSGTSGGILGFTATGTVASSGALTQNALLLGGGAGATPSALGSLGTSTTVLHGNAAGAPTFGAVDLTADITGTLPVANGGTNYTGGVWTPFTCTLSSSSGSITTQASNSYYLQIGKLVIVNINIVITTIGTASGTYTCNIPFAPKTPMFLTGREYGTLGIMISLQASGGSTTATLIRYDNGNPTLANGSAFSAFGVYQQS